MIQRNCFYCGKSLPGEEFCPECDIPCSGGVGDKPCINKADTSITPWGPFAHCPKCEEEWNLSLDEYMDDYVKSLREESNED